MFEAISDFFSDPAIRTQLPAAFAETVNMVTWSSLLTIAVGIPFGLYLHYVSPVGLRPRPQVYRVAAVVVNLTMSLPFVMLVVLLLPLIRAIFGTTSGWPATVLPLAIAAIPFLARLVEISVRTVSQGKIEAALMAGANQRQVVTQVELRETFPLLVTNVTVTVISLISFSAMAGVVGGGGLGYLAISYGYLRFNTEVMIITLAVIILFVQIVQFAGDRLTAKLIKNGGSFRGLRLRERD